MKNLVLKYGKDKINTLTKYPSILTLHKLGDKGKLLNEFTTPISSETFTATEKIDGTNARIIILGNEYLIGAREFICHYSEDLYFDNAQFIVQGLKDLNFKVPYTTELTVIYGEFYGGKTSANSKQYGKEINGFRVFDVAVFEDLSILEKDLSEISKWRETETNNGIIYGQKFLNRDEIETHFPELELVPTVNFSYRDTFIQLFQYSRMRSII